ncbi:hypothetical protein COY07_00470 [Candidatus Peregrinibacteria bacterium CG_4_10_14_0_2_um_filter_43_11]|nr:MAG: hypothetical protein COY07_00470 [Candidatus Peregrinibacteria bacterium CG_4_10_14_0_2_um_filter_43_11]
MGFIFNKKTKMTHHDIHEIITQISQTLDCPQCKTRILPHNIAITDVVGPDCTFDVACHHCKAEMTLSAHVEKTVNDTAKTFNRSSQIMHDGIVEKGISIKDVESVQHELRHFCGSFIEAFCH